MLPLHGDWGKVCVCCGRRGRGSPWRQMLSREWGEVDGFGGNETHVETSPHILPIYNLSPNLLQTVLKVIPL